jgi:hypothetical protein
MRKVTARARSGWSDRSQAFRSRRAGALAVERRRTASRVAKLERQAFVRRAASPRIILLWNGVWFSIPGAIRSMKSFEAMDGRDGDHRLLPSVDRASCLAAQPVAVVDTDFLRGIQLVWNALELGCRPSAPSRLCRYRGRYFEPRQRLLVGASAMAVAVPRTVSRAFLPRALTGRYTGSGGTCRDRSWRRHFSAACISALLLFSGWERSGLFSRSTRNASSTASAIPTPRLPRAKIPAATCDGLR